MKILRVYPTSINDRFIDEIVETLRDGGLVVYPTDTMYAIGCDALNQRAIERVCRLKGINPDKQMLSVVCSDLSQASDYARIDNVAFRHLKTHLPGPFTFVLPASTKLPKVFKGRKTVGVRIPDDLVARRIAESLGNPILSATIAYDEDDFFGATDPEAIAMRYEPSVDIMVNTGTGRMDASTVVDLTDSASPQILRQGAAPFE